MGRPTLTEERMNPLALVAAGVAAGIHVFFFVLESLTFTKPETWRRFNVASQRDADLLGPLAFNQGFYNLFLAIGTAVGIVAAVTGHVDVGRPLIVFACASMALAGGVLVVTDRRLIGSAIIQSTPPLIALIAAFF
jgi:putative membrane protein